MAINWPSLAAVPTTKLAKITWPLLLAHAILAAEDPTGIAQGLNPKKKPPELDETPAPPMSYIDVVNVWITYFHPAGKHYIAIAPDDPKYADLGASILDLIERSRHHRGITVSSARKLMLRVGMWAITNKLAPVAFKNLIMAWAKKDYAKIDAALTAALPEGHAPDIAPIFHALAQVMGAADDETPAGPPEAPADAPAAPDVPIDPSAPNAADLYIQKTFPDDWHLFIPVPLPNTTSSAEYKKLYGQSLVSGQKLGLTKAPGKFFKLLRAYSTTKITDTDENGDLVEYSFEAPVIYVVMIDAEGEVNSAFDSGDADDPGMAELIVKGLLVPYVAPAGAIAEPAQPPVQPTKREMPDMQPGQVWARPDGVLMFINKVTASGCAAQMLSELSPSNSASSVHMVEFVSKWNKVGDTIEAEVGGVISTKAPHVTSATISYVSYTGLPFGFNGTINLDGMTYVVGARLAVSTPTSQPLSDPPGYVVAWQPITTHSGNALLTVRWLGANDVAKLQPAPPIASAPPSPENYYPAVSGALLSTPLKKYLADKGLTAVNPPEVPFHVGTKVTGGKKIAAYAKSLLHTNLLVVFESHGSFDNDVVSALAGAEAVYQDSTVFDTAMGTVIGKGTEGVGLVIAGAVAFPSEATPDLTPVPILQPVPQNVAAKQAAGIVCIIPTGGGFFANGATAHKPTSPMLVLVHPLGDFGSELTFPKGTVEPAEGLTEAAIREFWEETNMHAAPVSCLGDFYSLDADDGVVTSATRMFVGYLRGGDPTKAPGVSPWTGKKIAPETDGVHFVELNGYAASKWYKKLNARDRKIVEAAAAWVNASGVPAAGMEELASADPPPQYTPPTSWANFDAASKNSITANEVHQTTSTIDYVVPTWAPGMVEAKVLEATTTGTGIKLTWAFGPAAPLTQVGYPVPGTTVQHSGKNFALFAYVTVSLNKNGELIQAVYALLRPRMGGPCFLLQLSHRKGEEAPHVLVPPAQLTAFDYDAPFVVAATSASMDIFQEFKKKAPYPVTDAMLAKLKAFNSNAAGVAELIGSTGPMGYPLYGAVTKMHSKGWVTVVGYVLVRYANSAPSQPGILSNIFAFCLGSDDQIELVTGGMVMSGETLTDTTPAAVLVHPNPVMSALLKIAAGVGNPWRYFQTRGYSFKAVLGVIAQAKPKQLVEHVSCATQSMLPMLCQLFAVPCPLSPAAVKHIVNLLADLAGKPKTGPYYKDPIWAKIAPAAQSPQPPGALQLGAFPIGLGKTPPPPVKTVAVAPFTPLSYYSLRAEVDALTAANLAVTGHEFKGGSNPHKVLIDNTTGKRYFLKGAKDGNAVRFVAEAVASDIYSQFVPDILPTRVFQHGSFAGSLQPVVDGVPPSLDFDSYTDAQKVTVLRQHVLDMFWGDHDAKADNWIVTPNGKMYPIDKGQTLRFFAQDMDGILDSFAIMTGNDSNRPLAKRILAAWAQNKTQLPLAAVQEMRRMIGVLQAYPMNDIKAITKPFADVAFKGNEAKATAFYARIAAWQKTYLELWTAEMAKLAAQRGAEFSWPVVGTVDVPDTKPDDIVAFNLDKITPKNMGMTSREEAVITKDVGKCGWRGKSIRVDKNFVENQEVLVKLVRYNAGGSVTDGTLLTWRVSYDAAEIATAALSGHAHEVFSAVGPVPLPFDAGQRINDTSIVRYYPTIRRALGHFNHNVAGSPTKGQAPKGELKVDFIEQVVSTFIPELEDLLAQAQQASSKTIAVSVGGKSYKVAPAALVGMVGKYLPHLQELALALDDWKKHGKDGKYWGKIELTHMTPDAPFTWQAPKEASVTPQATGYSVSAAKQGLQPNTSVLDGSKIMVLYEGGVAQYLPSFQFIITGTGSNKVIIHFTPAKTPQGQGTKTHWGQCWATIPQAPSPSAVAKVLALFEKATGIGMKTATKLDNEVHFWAKQAYALQPNYVSPDEKGQGAATGGELAAGLLLYSQGKDVAARDQLRAFVAARLKVSPAEAEEMAAKSEYMQGQHTDVPGAPEGGAGRRRFMRLGYDRLDLFKSFGQNAAIAHNTGVPMKTFVQRSAPKNGALIAKADFATYVGPWQGDTSQAAAGSSSSDFSMGGASNLFLSLRSVTSVKQGHLYFDISLLLRVDTYVVEPHGDGFGDFMRPRALSIEAIRKAVGNKGEKNTEHVGYSESAQIVARHEIDLQEWLYYAGCSDAAEREACISLCKQNGLTSFFGGRTPEQVFVIHGPTAGVTK